MALFDPFMGREVGRLLEWLETSKPPQVRFSLRIWEPAVAVFETEGRVEVWVELAGVKQESIEIFVDTGSLIIKGWRGEKTRESRDYYQVEIFQGPFERNVDLPLKVDTDRAQAFYDEGMLKIVLPEASTHQGTYHVQVRTITVT